MRLRFGLLMSLAAGSLIPSPVRAKVAAVAFKDLVAGSEVIVVAQVTKVEAGGKDQDVATARVIEVWKGSPGAVVRYLASPTWTCDISDAKEGERIVLFLAKSKDSPLLTIAHSGRGRMPLREVEGKSYATLWTIDVILLDGTPTIPGPEPDISFIRSIEIGTLKKLVRRPNP